MSGSFVVSLDFELVWGVFEKARLLQEPDYFLRTRNVIPQILDRFEAAEVAATWATVGMLFQADWDAWDNFLSIQKPAYENPQRSSYQFAIRARNELPAACFFAPDLIRRIIHTPRQEIGTHTYSHYYCLEPGQTARQFDADLQLARKAAADFGLELKSLVFPRNQFQPEYLEICRRNGIQQVRTNPHAWYWQRTGSGMLARLARTADCYLPLSKKGYPASQIETTQQVTLQPASRFLRPQQPGLNLLNRLRTQRIMAELTAAAKTGAIYHLWWHPHNFAIEPEAALQNLDAILKHFQTLHSQFDMQSYSMADLGDRCRAEGTL